MTQNVCDRFRKELFIERNPKLSAGIFRSCFDSIFPDAEEFEEFLLPATANRTTELAKELFSRLQFSLYLPIPSQYANNLLYIESTTNEIATPSHIGQDHYVHSIYLYLTGIYCFFNHETLHEQILSQFEQCVSSHNNPNPFTTPYHERVAAFIKAWKYFSLYHDIGYVFEKTITGDNRIDPRNDIPASLYEEYNRPELYLAHDLALKELAHFLLFAIIAAKSTAKLSDAISINTSDPWAELSHGQKASGIPDIKSALEDCFDYSRLFNVVNYNNLSTLFPFISLDNCIILAYTRNGELCAIKRGDIIYFRKDICSLTQNELTGMEYIGSFASIDIPYYCEYYFPSTDLNFEAAARKIDLYSWEPQLRNILPSVIEKNSRIFSFFTKKSDFNSMHYNLFLYLKLFLSIEALNSPFHSQINRLHSQNIASAIETIVRKTTNSYIEYISKMELSESQLDQILYQLASKVKSIQSDEIKHELRKTREPNLVCEETLHACARHLFVELQVQLKMNVKMVEIRQLKDASSIFVYPLAVREVMRRRKRQIASQKTLLKRMLNDTEQKLSQLNFIKKGENCDVLLNHIPKYTRYDHGIMSASILGNILCSFLNLISNENKETLYKCAFSCPESKLQSQIHQEIESIWRTSFFAILIHNIYGDYYEEMTGNKYMQNVSKNAFSYFCALCDCIQFWNRNQQYNPAQLAAPYSYYSGDTDIEIRNNKIRISCKSSDLKNAIKKRKLDFQEFLQDADSMIYLDLKEL